MKSSRPRHVADWGRSSSLPSKSCRDRSGHRLLPLLMMMIMIMMMMMIEEEEEEEEEEV